MEATLRELADLVGGRVSGDGELKIHGAGILRDALPGEITLADKSKYANALATAKASAVVVPESFQPTGISTITVVDVHSAFAKIVRFFRPAQPRSPHGVSPDAVIHPTARIGSRVTIHAGASIGEGVEIGDECVIHAGVRILAGCRLGQQVVIFPNAVLYEDTRVGDRSIIHASAVLGAYGFGYDSSAGRHRLSAQIGYVEIGADVEIGACTTIDRGTYGPTSIGEGTKIDNQVMIAHNCRIGRHNLLCSHVGVAGSCTTGDYVVLAGQVGVRDHVNIGDRVIVGAQSGITCDLASDSHYLGSPAIPERDEIRIMAARSKLLDLRKQIKMLEKAVEELQTHPANGPQGAHGSLVNSANAATQDAA
jgi:UDP-3-O-[3-hydroxymyristoyl] glucosamine N-acyltransferase